MINRTEGAIMGLSGNLELWKFSGIHKDDPVNTVIRVEMVPELAFLCIQIDDYLNCYHITFI